MTLTLTKKGFSIVELLVVLVIMGTLMAVFVTSFSNAQKKAKISKAETEVKEIHKAILAYENESEDYTLDDHTMKDRDADKSSLGFLLPKKGATDSKANSPVLMAQLKGDQKMLDPWGTPYKVTIRRSNGGSVRPEFTVGGFTGYYLPNFNRLSAEERK